MSVLSLPLPKCRHLTVPLSASYHRATFVCSSLGSILSFAHLYGFFPPCSRSLFVLLFLLVSSCSLPSVSSQLGGLASCVIPFFLPPVSHAAPVCSKLFLFIHFLLHACHCCTMHNSHSSSNCSCSCAIVGFFSILPVPLSCATWLVVPLQHIRLLAAGFWINHLVPLAVLPLVNLSG